MQAQTIVRQSANCSSLSLQTTDLISAFTNISNDTNISVTVLVEYINLISNLLSTTQCIVIYYQQHSVL